MFLSSLIENSINNIIKIIDEINNIKIMILINFKILIELSLLLILLLSSSYSPNFIFLI